MKKSIEIIIRGLFLGISSSLVILGTTTISCISINKAINAGMSVLITSLFIFISNIIIFIVYLKVLDIIINFSINKFKKNK